jgi:tRNA A37 methylthiotransferase MiaB
LRRYAAVSLMRLVKYEHAYMFVYSMRDKTAAARHLAGAPLSILIKRTKRQQKHPNP